MSNALTVVLGWVGEARAPGASGESIAYALRIIEERARAARDLARLAIGVAVPAVEQNDLLDVILSQTLDALAIEAQRAKVALDLTTPSTGEHVPSGGELSQIVTNLVMNAMAHAPPGSTVRVTVDTSVRGVHVDVEDEGPGVPASRRTSIFDGDTTRAGGAGVGLRHARSVARACGGEVELVPTEGGAFFRVTWPHVGTMPSAPPSVARSRALDGMRVLVVEDDADVIALLDTALTARGAELVVARSAAELTKVMAPGRPPVAAALVDLSPIAADLAGAIATIRKSSPAAALVGMTGSAEGLPAELAGAGATCVRKPFEVPEIVAAIVSALARRP